MLVTAATFGGVTSAQAAPTGASPMRYPGNCSLHTDYTGALAICRGGTGQVRAVTRCDENNRPDYNRYGAWVRPGAFSVAACDSGDRSFSRGYHTR
ncbi:hypothetical protein [Pseudonocardia humida]|uniref:DUF3011 domain-containing protein n=1 Tax=Pseudonocardia humida TaxID=2800819 RepID=A0ABT0ZVG5_9PSEU|nr:hypothetical protein [Pseudonocardia humida]MCO1654737.1 hypothetical protein [Pseudonocardia humida]